MHMIARLCYPLIQDAALPFHLLCFPTTLPPASSHLQNRHYQGNPQLSDNAKFLCRSRKYMTVYKIVQLRSMHHNYRLVAKIQGEYPLGPPHNPYMVVELRFSLRNLPNTLFRKYGACISPKFPQHRLAEGCDSIARFQRPAVIRPYRPDPIGDFGDGVAASEEYVLAVVVRESLVSQDAVRPCDGRLF